MKKIIRIICRKGRSALIAGVAAGVFLGASLSVAHAQSLPPGVQDVVKLAQAGISDDVILSQIKNNQATYNLSADQIITLKNQGVSQAVIKALLGGGGAAAAPANPAPAPSAAPAPASTPVAAPNPPPAVPVASSAATPDVSAPAPSLQSFQAQLAPDGTWIDVPGLGLCWLPTVVTVDPLWRPYVDHGHWTYSDDGGWAWDSDYSWGNIVFHYGRWTQFNGRWVWVPGYDWAPAWVCWREADGYCGWAPLPPAAVYHPGIGLYYNGAVAFDVDFGLGLDAFTFVGYDHFWDFDLRPHYLPHDRLVLVFHDSHVLNGYRFAGGHFFIGGLGRDHIVLVTHHDVIVGRGYRGGFWPGRDYHDDRHFHDDRHPWGR